MRGISNDPAPDQDTEPVPAGGAHAAQDLPAARWFGAATAVAAVTVFLAGWFTQRRFSQWFADDFLYLQLAKAGKLSPSWLAKDNYGHFAPLTRLAYFVVQRTVGLDYPVATLLPAALVTTIFLSQVLLYHELLGRRPLSLVLALCGTGSVPVVKTMLWWGAAVHVLGAAAMMTLTVATFVVYSRHGQERYRVASVSALALGLLVQERPILTIGYLVLIRYLFRAGLGPRSTGLLRRETRFWAPWATVEICYLVYRVFLFPSSPQPGDTSNTISLVWQSIFRGYAPALVGTRVAAGDPLLTWQAVVGLLALLLATGALAWHRRGAWRSVAFLVAIYVVNLGIVAVGRLDVSSIAVIVGDLQYYVDVLIGTLMAFVLGFSTLPARAAPLGRERLALWRVLVPVAVLALAVSTALTLRGVTGANQTTAAHGYVNRVESELEAEPGPYDLLRTKLPLSVAPTFIEPYTDVSSVFALDRDVGPRLDPTASKRLVVTGEGRLVVAHPTTLEMVPLDQDTTVARVGTIRQTTEGGCLSGPAGANVLVRLPESVGADGLFFALTYSSTRASAVRPVMISGHPAYNENLTPLPAGSHTVVDRLDGRQAHVIVLGFDQAVAGLCLKSLWIGRISAVTAGGCHVLTVYGEPARSAHDCSASWPSP